ncbi:MAG: aromatic aminobenezylarsenical efflux permease ArsG family transporter [Bacteroidetes bacterium]|nr:aromatic aminobenezylarsenical efflux permease ArsG family transporter [Bacteroidota bacterium]
MQFLQTLLDQSQFPILTAFLLGLMTAISPCTLATNITAIGFISKDVVDKRRILINGIIYTMGRAFSYTTLGVILYLGASKFHIARFFQSSGEKYIGPLLVIIGILMLDVIRIKLPRFRGLSDIVAERERKNTWWSAFLLGIVFALAFCPYSGVLYFGMLIPITISSVSGLYLPLIFAIATGLPVIIIAWILAYSVSSLGSFYNHLKTFEKWFRRVVSIVFILVGIYYIYIFYLKA